MNKIGVFYGSTTGTTEDLARRIAELYSHYKWGCSLAFFLQEMQLLLKLFLNNVLSLQRSKHGVFYGSTTGTTEDLARRIAEKLDVPSAHIYDVSKLTEALVVYSGIIALFSL